MPRYRRHRRTYALARPLKIAKYSNETFAAISTYNLQTSPNALILFSKKTDILGTRKTKNFSLSLVSDSQIPFLFALVFVPEGTTPGNLNQGSTVDEGVLIPTSIYEPNQNVIMSGLFGGPNSTCEKFKTRLARNLNAGDQIFLIIKSLVDGEGTASVNAVLNYVISY